MKNKRTIHLCVSFLAYWSTVVHADRTTMKQTSPKRPAAETPPSPSGLQAYMLTTTDTRTYDLRESTVEFEPQASMSPKNILLNPQQIYQTMQGFGAALTGSSAFCLKLMKQEDRTAFLKRTYSLTEGYGCSYVRIAIGCSDFSLKEYTCCDTPGIENFALTSEETDYVIPILKEIIAINPGHPHTGFIPGLVLMDERLPEYPV